MRQAPPTCICTLKARRVKGTRKPQPCANCDSSSQTTIFTIFNSIPALTYSYKRGDNLRVKLDTPPILRVGPPTPQSPSGRGEQKTQEAVGRARPPELSLQQSTFANGQLCVSCDKQWTYVESIDDRIPRLPVNNYGGRYHRQTGRCREREGEARG